MTRELELTLSKKEKSKNKIMHAAKCLFENNGFDKVTFNQIAVEADVCRTTVFNHFSNVNELMLAINKQEIDDIEEHCLASGLLGRELIDVLFDKLIEDTSN